MAEQRRYTGGGWGSERWRDTLLAAIAEVFSC